MCINFKILFMLKEEGVKMKFKNITIVTKLKGGPGPGGLLPDFDISHSRKYENLFTAFKFIYRHLGILRKKLISFN